MRKIFFFGALFPALILATGLWADEVMDRMKGRLPVIMELKTQGIVGENNKGLLEFIGGLKEKEKIVNAENEDRKTVYDGIAKKYRTTVEAVGKRRALKIAEKAKLGVWLQDKTGKWYKK